MPLHGMVLASIFKLRHRATTSKSRANGWHCKCLPASVARLLLKFFQFGKFYAKENFFLARLMLEKIFFSLA